MTLSCAVSLILVVATSVVVGQFTNSTVSTTTTTVSSTVSATDGPIDVVLYIESRCPDSSRFIKNHLVPFYRQYPTVIRNLKVVPFGIADCVRNPSTGNINCTCQHHQAECDMNQLMNCVMYYRPQPEHLPMLACIQGRTDILDAASHCISFLSKAVQSELIACAKGPQGAQLHYEAGKRTKQASVNWVPWIEINGKRYKEAEHIFHQEICKRSSLC
uniref:Uncharacterized protein n=1 Tax=Plectus sambesii TaxID=2011161 RepID=A0A914WY55_9BILA